MNNHFSAQAVANATMLQQLLDEPVTARMPAELVVGLPDARRPRRYFASRTVTLMMRSVTCSFGDDVHAADHLAEHGVLAVERAPAG